MAVHLSDRLVDRPSIGLQDNGRSGSKIDREFELGGGAISIALEVDRRPVRVVPPMEVLAASPKTAVAHHRNDRGAEPCGENLLTRGHPWQEVRLEMAQ
jgi:hypothetical protein